MKGRVLLFDINDINTTSSLTSPHQSIRQTAQDNYLKSQHKRQKEYDKHLEKIADSYKNGDIVGIAINKVDRTNCDPKIMPCMIEKRSDNPDIPMYHLISPYGRLSISFPVHQLIPMSGIQPTLLKTAKFKDSETITFVQASKLFARGNPCATCDCKTKCRTKTCPCRRASIPCSTKCHAKLGKCMNMDEETC
jgi:hypothetical protein